MSHFPGTAIAYLMWLVVSALLFSGQAIGNPTPLSRADARHLLSRTGLGVDHQSLIRLSGITRTAAIDYIINGFTDTPALPMPEWTRMPAPLYWTRRDLASDERQLFDRRRDLEFIELRQWWVDNMLTTNSPQTERMVLFWHDHFATSYYGINRQAKALAIQNQTFRELALGDFRILLKRMIRDPALLNYLDNLSNRKGAPNENFSRELLELFTMGEGQYDQHTVSEAARALTGHGVSQNRDLLFELKSWNHDETEKTLFGYTGYFNADDLIDLILQQPATAAFIATKFWHAFVSDQTPSRKQLQPLISAFTENNYNLASLYRAILESDAFWHPDNRATIIKSPVQLIIGTARTLEFPKHRNHTIPALMERSGMNLLAPPNVAGWADGMAWITPGRLINRQASIKDLISSKATSTSGSLPNMMVDAGMMSRMKNMRSAEEGLQLHIAAENYKGAAIYQVELLDRNNALLWKNKANEVSNGHETTQYGRIKNVSDLPWQTVDVGAKDSVLEQARTVRVHFTNDDAGNNGDRNLFVSGVSLDNIWYDSSQGTQQSKCIPRSKFKAGSLYCNGYIDIAINHKESKPATIKIAASSAHVNWVRARDNQLDLTVALQDFHYLDLYFATFTFHLQSEDSKAPRLELNSLGSWPDSPIEWPDCAWQDPLNNTRKTLAFFIPGPGDSQTLQCHHHAVNKDIHQLVSSLFNSAANLTHHASSSPRQFDSEERGALTLWQQSLQKHDAFIQKHHGTAPPITIDAALKRKTPSPRAPHRFVNTVSSPMELQRIINNHGLTPVELLLPGVSIEKLPEINNIARTSPHEQIEWIVSHPIFQLH